MGTVESVSSAERLRREDGLQEGAAVSNYDDALTILAKALNAESAKRAELEEQNRNLLSLVDTFLQQARERKDEEAAHAPASEPDA